MAEDGVHEVVGGIAAEGEERGVGRILALRGVEGLGFKNFFYFFYLLFLLLFPRNFPAQSDFPKIIFFKFFKRQIIKELHDAGIQGFERNVKSH